MRLETDEVRTGKVRRIVRAAGASCSICSGDPIMGVGALFRAFMQGTILYSTAQYIFFIFEPRRQAARSHCADHANKIPYCAEFSPAAMFAPLSFSVKEPWPLRDDHLRGREGEVSYWEHLVGKALRCEDRRDLPGPVLAVPALPLRTFPEMLRVAHALVGPRGEEAKMGILWGSNG